jgi:hypothetical protein
MKNNEPSRPTTLNRRGFLNWAAAGSVTLATRRSATAGMVGNAVAKPPLVPEIDEDFWTLTGNPDLGPFSSPGQQPVDFGVWQAADCTWQLWSCIRSTKVGGHTRLFYRWQGGRLTDRNWEPMGIALRADPGFGEIDGGLQAPFVLKVGASYSLFYGDWEHICLATSVDGKTFARQLTKNGTSGMFANAAGANTRDPMVLAHDGRYYCYTTAHPLDRGAVYCRVSTDLRTWGTSRIVSVGGRAGTGPSSAECPFVYRHKETGTFYLFRTQRYGRDAHTSVYAAPTPLDFGIRDDRYLVTTLSVAAPELVEHEGTLYLACLNAGLDGIRMARLRWVRRPS